MRDYNLILRSAASLRRVSKDGSESVPCIHPSRRPPILRQAQEGGLLRMRSELFDTLYCGFAQACVRANQYTGLILSRRGGRGMTILSSNRHFLGIERSATGRAWCDRLDDRGNARSLAIAQRHGMPELLARIVAGRSVEVDGVEAYLDPTIKQLMPDPDVITDIKPAASRIADAIMRGEQVAIFGDYDVDGATSAALLASFLRIAGLDPLIHIPDRIFEGYGPNIEAIGSLAGRSAKLLVTVDCGTTSMEPIAEAKRLGLDTIVIDHHQADENLPPAVAVVNPNRLDDLSGLGHLAAVGLGFLAVVAINRELRRRGFWSTARPEPDLMALLDLVALGTITDVVALT